MFLKRNPVALPNRLDRGAAARTFSGENPASIFPRHALERRRKSIACAEMCLLLWKVRL
jgi:hypothetical protein